MKRSVALLVFTVAAAALPAVSLRYYFSPDCGSCRDFLGREVPRVEKAVGRNLRVELRDIRLPGVLDELEAALAARGLQLTSVPVLVLDDAVLAGSKQIKALFEAEVRRIIIAEGRPGALDGSGNP
jgi:hypothetical protein